jgi:hypothetical protein
MANPRARIKILTSIHHGVRLLKKGGLRRALPRNETVLTNGFESLEHKAESDLDDAICQGNVTVLSKR